MRLVKVEVNKSDIRIGQTQTKEKRMGSDPVFLAAKRAMPDTIMVGRDSINGEIFGIPLPPEAIQWIAYADRHYQGLEAKPPKPIKFNVIHPL
jgi:hypothetical protein